MIEIKKEEKFKAHVTKGWHASKSIAFALVACIQHQFVYTKKDIFKLNHTAISSFGLNRRNLQQYLKYFKEANLLEYTITSGKVTTIQLLLLPYNYYIVNNNNIKEYTKMKDTGVHLSTGDRLKSTGNLYIKEQVTTKYTKAREGREQAREVRQGSKVSKLGKVAKVGNIGGVGRQGG
ncbi:MAG: hypothetical protein MUO82_01995 [Candidatus Thermoplasmatota archaeon]|nr:hypothetical protein [Candidatus Thermoplasmatota archaeon]